MAAVGVATMIRIITVFISIRYRRLLRGSIATFMIPGVHEKVPALFSWAPDDTFMILLDRYFFVGYSSPL